VGRNIRGDLEYFSDMSDGTADAAVHSCIVRWWTW